MLQFAFDALVALLPTSLGQKTKANSLAVTVASDQDVLATSTKQSDGTQKAQTVDASGNVQPAGDTAARPIWTKLSDGAAALFDAAARAGWVKVTDGTNSMPTADAAARAIFAKITDGTALLFDAAARAGFVKVTDGTNVQPTGDAVARGIYVRPTDGTNTMPTGDAVGRALFTKTTDGTNVMAVKAASTAPTTTDPAAVVAFSPNDLAVKALTPQSSGSPLSIAEVTTGANTTAVQLGSLVAPSRGIVVQAHPGNSINIRVDAHGTASSTRGIVLAPGKGFFFPITNANLLDVCNESGTASKVEVIGV